jgi:predicted dehydrogenase
MYNEGTLPDSTETGEVDNEDECNFMANFKSGAKGYFRVSRFHEAQGDSFHGSEGVLKWDKGKLTGKRDVGSEMVEIDVPDPELPETIVSQFVRNILNGTALPPSFYDGLRAQEVMHAVDQSSRDRKWVSLSI